MCQSANTFDGGTRGYAFSSRPYHQCFDRANFNATQLSTTVRVDSALTDTISFPTSAATRLGSVELGDSVIINFFPPNDCNGLNNPPP